jgi:hypothetical protein
MSERAKARLKSLAVVRAELERVKADADDLIDRISADLARAERETANAPRPSKAPVRKPW